MTEPPKQPETPPPPPGYPGGASYPPPPPMPYGGQVPPPAAPRNGLGTAALVLAILGLISCWTVFGGVILGLIAVVLGFVGRGRVKRGEANNGGVALAGIVLGFLSLIAGLVFIPIYVWTWNLVGGDDYYDCMMKAGNDQAAQQQCAEQFKHHLETKFSVTLTTAP